MSLISLLFAFISSTCAAAASILLRLDGTGTFAWQVPFGAFLPKIAALAVYGVGFLFYALTLRTTEVRIAYPVMVSMTVIGLLAWSAVFESTPDLKALFGIALILSGIFLTVR